eukprot:GHVS01003504.1.p2 GENE.GHVS01003504.1~~GHVS01003504.1.p2  ORF type:complete len:116 (+),score=2.44 GHVS01003504.1:70-417(+)
MFDISTTPPLVHPLVHLVPMCLLEWHGVALLGNNGNSCLTAKTSFLPDRFRQIHGEVTDSWHGEECIHTVCRGLYIHCVYESSAYILYVEGCTYTVCMKAVHTYCISRVVHTLCV